MTLVFTREVLIIEGFPIIGEITVEVEGQLDRYDGLYDLSLTCTGFEPEIPQGLTWAAVGGACEAWLAANRARVEKKALNHREADSP